MLWWSSSSTVLNVARCPYDQAADHPLAHTVPIMGIWSTNKPTHFSVGIKFDCKHLWVVVQCSNDLALPIGLRCSDDLAAVHQVRKHMLKQVPSKHLHRHMSIKNMLRHMPGKHILGHVPEHLPKHVHGTVHEPVHKLYEHWASCMNELHPEVSLRAPNT